MQTYLYNDIISVTIFQTQHVERRTVKVGVGINCKIMLRSVAYRLEIKIHVGRPHF